MKKLLCIILAALALLPPPVHAATAPIKIGLITDLTKLSEFTVPSQNGVRLAIDEANAAGGIKGRPVELIVRDDHGNAADSQTVIADMDKTEKVDAVLAHGWSHIAASLSEYGGHNHLPVLTFWMTINEGTWKNYNPYGFSIDDTPLIEARALVERVKSLPYKRWYIAGPDVGYGRSISESFKSELKKVRPDVEFVGEVYTPAMKIDANAVVGAILSKHPDAVFSPYFGPDLSQYIRVGKSRGLFADTFHVNPMAGFPESMSSLKTEFPPNWLVLGYPGTNLKTPEYLAFVDSYQAHYHQPPQWAGTVGYIYAKMLLQAMARTDNVTHEQIAKQLPTTSIDSPFGHISMRTIDNRSNMGAWTGYADFSGGAFKLRDAQRYDVNKLAPPDDWIKAQRSTQKPTN